MIKRYNLVSKEGSFAANGYCVLSTQESETGAWVKYEDYDNLLRMYEHVLVQYNKQEDRILNLSYKAYPARNGSGE